MLWENKVKKPKSESRKTEVGNQCQEGRWFIWQYVKRIGEGDVNLPIGG
jgi:hypothetical protein